LRVLTERLSPIGTCVRAAHSEYKAVLVDVVQSIQHPKPMALSILVALNALKSFPSFGVATDFGVLPEGSLMSRDIVEDGKVELFIYANLPSMTSTKLVCQMVKRASEVLNYISEDRGYFDRDRRDRLDLVSVLFRLHIGLLHNLIGIRSKEPMDTRFQLIKVVVCARHLNVDSREAVSHSR
jgi:hypothetical protein